MNLELIIDADTGSISLLWDPPSTNADCVVHYAVNSSLINHTITITNTSYNFTVVNNTAVLDSCVLTASVAAVDTGSRIGWWTDGVVFSFTGDL